MFDNRLAAFGSMLLVIFLAAMDATIVATALPAITADLGGTAQVGWVIAGFLLGTAVSIPVWGKAADLVARRSLYLAAAMLFVVSSAAIGAAPSMTVLIVARVVQGLGTGGLMALTPTIVGVLFPAETRARYQGIMGAVLAGASVIGPLVGGTIVDSVGWRWAFFVNVPLGAVAIGVVFGRLRLASEPAGGRRIDVPGAALVVVAVVSLLFVFGESVVVDSTSARLGLGAVSLVATVAYVIWQRTTPDPIVPLRLLRDRTVGGGVALSLTSGVAMIVVTIHQPLSAQAVDGASATEAGLTLLPLTIALMLSSLAAGGIVTRLGRYRPVLVAGTVLSVVGVALTSGRVIGDGTAVSSLGLTLTGVGVGLTMQPALLAVQNAVAASDLGAGTAATAFFRQIGSTLAIGILAGLLTSRVGNELRLLEDGGSLTGADADAVSDAIGFNLLAAAAIASAAVVIALAMPDRRLGDSDPPPTSDREAGRPATASTPTGSTSR